MKKIKRSTLRELTRQANGNECDITEFADCGARMDGDSDAAD